MNPTQVKFLDRLKSMQGKKFNYAGKEFIFKEYKIDSVRNRVTIKTDSSEFEKKYDNVESFLDLWFPADNAPVLPQKVNGGDNHLPEKQVNTNGHQLPDFLATYNDQASSLTQVLKDVIEKVKTDKDYIPQASAINTAVNSIVTIEKLKLDVYRTYRDLKPTEQ